MSGPDGTGIDLPDRRADRVARVYATLSRAYEAIVRIRERRPLFEQVCRVLVEDGRLRMAWVGEVDDHGWIVPVAHAGATDGYLDNLRISTRDVAEGRGPTGTAVRERQLVFVRDVATDERMVPWRDAALARGYRTSAAFPLMVDDRSVAVLTAYAPEPGFFDEEEVELFDRLAADLSFALEAMQREERRRAAEAQLRASEERFRVAAESMLDGFGILSPVRDDDGEITGFRYRYVNDAYCGLVGFDRERLLGHPVGELFPQFPGGARFELYRRVAVTGEPCRTEDVHLPSTWTGTALDSRALDTVIASMGDDVVFSVRDITERRRAEAELAHVKGLLERTQVISKAGGWEYDLATGKLTRTGEVYRIFGDERTGRPVELEDAIAGYGPESAPVIGAAFHRLVTEGEPYDLELSVVRADGERIWVRATGAPMMEDGRIVRVGGMLADITERKEAEQELQLRAELLDLAHDAVIVREPVEGRVTFWNREAERIYGYSRGDAAGRITHELLATVFPESRHAVDEALAQHGRWEGELRHTCMKGAPIIVSSRQALQRDADGKPLAIIELNSDITKRKQAEAERERALTELQEAQQITQLGSWYWDPTTEKRTWSPGMYAVYGRDPAAGPIGTENSFARVHPDDLERVRGAYDRMLAGGEQFDLEYRLLTGDRGMRTVRAIARPDPGQPGSYRGTLQDVTESREAEEAIRTLNAELEERVAARTADLERANRELQAFVYSVSHDLRAPLRAMDGFSRLLSTEYAGALDERGQHYLARVRAGAQRMGTMIDDLLQLSRVSRAELHRDRIDLSELAGQIALELQTAEPDRRVEFAIADGLTAIGDRDLVRVALENLLGNAWKFTSTCERARIEFTTRECGDRREFVVRDNGAGFDMRHVGQLFRPFQRLHGANEFPGTGIGLASVDRIITRHGGHVSAHGEVGRGATFAFTLAAGEAR